MALRDVWVTFRACIGGREDNLAVNCCIHYCCSCCDICLLGSLVIWGCIALNYGHDAELCNLMPEEVGCRGFYKATKANVVIGFLYIIAHCCVFPLLVFYISHRASSSLRRRLNEDFDDLHVRDEEQGEAAINSLTTGNF